jgi:hypothetical protein
LIRLAALTSHATGVEQRLDEEGLPLTTCPGSSSREKLIANKIRITTYNPDGTIRVAGPDKKPHQITRGDASTLTEGRRLLLDADSYPRKPGRLTGGPTLVNQADGLAVRFALDRYDDVAVRIVDARGVRRQRRHADSPSPAGPQALGNVRRLCMFAAPMVPHPLPISLKSDDCAIFAGDE